MKNATQPSQLWPQSQHRTAGAIEATAWVVWSSSDAQSHFRTSCDAHLTGKEGDAAFEVGVGVPAQTVVTAVIFWNAFSQVINSFCGIGSQRSSPQTPLTQLPFIADFYFAANPATAPYNFLFLCCLPLCFFFKANTISFHFVLMSFLLFPNSILLFSLPILCQYLQNII